jgi:hypothetical protein
MRALALFCLLTAAMPLGAERTLLPWAGGSWSPPPGGSAAPRTPADLNWADPAGLEPAGIRPGLNRTVRIPGIPREATLSAAVEDRYDWLPTYGANADRDRPWLRVASQWSFPGAGVKTFAGIGATVPLASPASGMLGQDPNALGASARGQVAVFAGVRF